MVRIEDPDGKLLASYVYDVWGKVIVSSGSVSAINPLKYRGYYHDTETGFYYLQSRYYDPVVSRFINADSYASTGQGFLGYNMFAYCGNNPVSRVDADGNKYTMIEDYYGNGKKNTIKAIGFHESVTAEQLWREHDIIPESQFYPWVVRSGVRQNELVESDNNSSYVSIYHETRSDAPWRSSIGGKIEIGNFAIQINGSIDNSGIMISRKDGNSIHSISYRADYTRLEVQLERSSTVRIGKNLTETQYDYMTVNKLFPLVAVAVAGTVLLGTYGGGPAGVPTLG